MAKDGEVMHHVAYAIAEAVLLCVVLSAILAIGFITGVLWMVCNWEG